MANITVDIQAKVVGYEQSIKALQAALAKVDPGSDMGKSITKAMEYAQSQVKALSKNMFPKASSDSQIDSIIEKTNRAGEAIQHVATLLQSVQVSDLNLGAFGEDIETFKNQITSLQAELDSKLNAGIVKAVGEYEQLKNVFKELGTDLSKATGATLLEDLSKGAQKAADDVADLEKKLEKAQTSINNYQTIDNALKSSKLGTLEGRAALDDELKTITGNYDAVIEQLRATMISGFSKLKTGTKLDTEGLLKTFFSDLTPENIQSHIQNLFNALSAQKVFGENEKRKFYEAIFGSNNEYNTNNVNLLTKSIGLDKAYEQYKAQFQEFYQKIVNDIDGKDQAQIKRLIDADQLDKAVSATTKALDSAYSKIYNSIKQNQERLNSALSDKDNIVLQLNTARQTQDTFSSAEQSLRQEIEAVRQENKSLENQIAQLREQLNQKLSGEAGNIRNVGAIENRNVGQGLRESIEISEAYKNQLAQVAAKEQALGKLQGVVQRWFSIYAAIRMVRQAVDSVISTIKELDATITEIAIVTSMDQSELWDQMPKYTQLARDYAASISGVYQVSQLYYQQGLQTADVMALTEQTLKMARISGLDYAQATDYMTNAIRSFKMEMTDAQRIVDVYSAIAAASATDTTELASAMSKTASSAQAVGSSFENTTAMMAVMIEATRESAENIGSALKSIISRYGEMKADPSKLVDSEGQEMSLNKVDTALQTVGISIHNAAGEFRDFDEVIMELAEKWNTIDTNTQRYIATVMAGNRQQSRFLALVSSYDRLKELSAEAADSEDASQLQFLKTLDSVEAKTQQLQTSIQALYVNSGLENFYKKILDVGNRIITTFDQLSEKNGLISVVGKIGGTFTSLATLVTTVFTTIKAHYSINRQAMLAEAEYSIAQEIADEQEKATKLGMIYDATTQSYIEAKEKEVAAAQEAAEQKLEIARQENNKQQTLKRTTTPQQKMARGGILASTIGLAATSYAANLDINQSRGLKAGMTGAGGALSGLGTTLMMWSTMGPGIAIAAGALSALPSIIEAIGMSTETTSEKLERLSKNIENANNTKLEAKSNLQTLESYKEKYDELNEKQYQSEEAKQEFIKIQNEIAASYPELIKGMTQEGNYVVDMTTAYEQLAAAKRKAYSEAFSADLGAEIQGLSDIHYVMKNIYGVNPFKDGGILSTNTYGKYDQFIYDQIQGNTDKTISSHWGDSLNTNDYFQTFFNGRENFQKLMEERGTSRGYTGYSSKAFEPTNTNAKQTVNQVWDLFLESAQKGLSFAEAQNNLNASLENGQINFNENPNVYKVGTSKDDYVNLASSAIEGFDQEIYSHMITIAKATEFQKDLIHNKIKSSNEEYVNILKNSAASAMDTESNELQNYAASLDLTEKLEQYIKDNEDRIGKDTYIDKATNTKKTVDEDRLIAEFYADKDEQWYNAFIEAHQKDLDDTANNIYKSLGSYSASEIERQDINDNARTLLLKALNEEYGKISERYSNWIQNLDINDSDIKAALDSYQNDFGPAFLQSIQNQYEKILNNTALDNDTKAIQLSNLTSIYDVIQDIQNQDFSAGTILLQAMQSADLTSLTGINNLIDSIQSLNIDFDTSGLIGLIQSFSSNLVVNFETEFQTYTEEIINKSKEFEKTFSKLTKGISFDEMLTTVNELGADIEDFDNINGKYYLKNLSILRDKYELSDQAFEQNIDNRIAAYGELSDIVYEEISEGISVNFDEYLNSLIPQNLREKLLNATNYEEYNKVLEEIQEYADSSEESAVNYADIIDLIQVDELKSESQANLNDLIDNAKNFSELETYLNEHVQDSWFTDQGLSRTQVYNEIRGFMNSESYGKMTFLDYVKNVLPEQWNAIQQATNDYYEDMFAQNLLAAGDVEGFIETAAKKSITNTVKSEDAFKNATVEEINNEVIKRYEELLQNNPQLQSQIISGDINNLPVELQKYTALIYDTFHSARESIVNSLIASVGDNGSNLIKVTDTNKKILEDLQAEGKDWVVGNIASGNYVTIAAEKLTSSANEFQNYIAQSFETTSEKIKALSQYHQNQYSNTQATSLDKVLTTEAFSYEDMLQYLVNNYQFNLDTSMKDLPMLMDRLGLAFNSAGEVIVSNYDAWITSLEFGVNKLKTSGKASQADLNKAQKKLDDAKNAQEQAIASGFDGILKDYSNISTESVENLANALNMSYEQLVGYINEAGEYVEGYLISNGDGTYQLDTSKLPTLLSTIKGKVSQATAEAIEKSISSIGDTYLSNIKNATSYTTKGASSLADVEAFRQSYADITGQILDENAFQYNILTQSFVLDPAAMSKYVDAQKELLTNMGYTEEFVNAYITDQTDKAIQAGIELDSFLNANTSKQRNDEANKLIQQIRGLSNYKNLFDIGTLFARFGQGEWTEQIAEQYDLLILKTLESGGQVAVDLLKKIKPDASQEELEAAFNSQINKLNDVVSQVGDLVAGQFVGTEGKLYEILKRAGAVDNNGIIQAGFNMVKVYAEIYKEMEATEGHTTSGLNQVYAQMITAHAQSNNDLKEILSNGISGISANSFATLMDHYGLNMKEVLENAQGLVIDSFGNIIISDFKAFEKWMNTKSNANWNSNDPAFKEIYSSYLDAKVELLNRPIIDTKTAAEQLNSILEAKQGQAINISYLGLDKLIAGEENNIKTTFEEILQKYGAAYEDGILTIGNEAQIPALVHDIGILAQKAGIIIPEQLAELEDAIVAMLDNIVALLSNGISGTLSHKDANTVINWYKSYAERLPDLKDSLNLFETADGLQFTESSLANIYELLKRIDSQKANALLEDIIGSRESFQSLTGALREFNDAMRLDGVDNATNKLKNLNGTLSNTAKMMQDVVQKAMTSPDSMNFMSNKLPDDMQTAVNAWENASQAIKTLTTSQKNGYMGVQDFYNIVNTASSLMVAAGKEFEVAGMDAATLLQKGAENVKVVDGKLTVDISSAGLDIQGSVGDLKKNLTTGINELASAEIAIIDAEIQVLEILAAMEQMGDMDVDVDQNGINFEVSDIFDFDAATGDLRGYTKAMQVYLNQLQDAIKSNDAAYKAAQEFKINGTTLWDLITGTADQWITTFGNAENASKFWQNFSKGIEGWDLEGNLQEQVLNFFKGLDSELNIDLGESGLFHIGVNGSIYSIDFSNEQLMSDAEKVAKQLGIDTENNLPEKLKEIFNNPEEISVEENLLLKVASGVVTVEYDKKGNIKSYKINGKTYTDANMAAAVGDLVQAGVKKDLPDDIPLPQGNTISGTINIGTAEITVTSDGNGAKYSKDGVKGGPFDDIDSLFDAWFEQDLENNGKIADRGSIDYKAWKVRKGINVDPVFEVKGREGDINKNATLRDAINDYIGGESAENIEIGDKATTVTLKDGIKVTIPNGALEFEGEGKDKKVVEESLKAYLGDLTGLDLGLKDTIKSAITDAFTSLSTLLTNLDSSKVTDLGTAFATVYTNVQAVAQGINALSEALTALTGIDLKINIELPDLPTPGEDGGEGAQNGLTFPVGGEPSGSTSDAVEKELEDGKTVAEEKAPEIGESIGQGLDDSQSIVTTAAEELGNAIVTKIEETVTKVQESIAKITEAVEQLKNTQLDIDADKVLSNIKQVQEALDRLSETKPRIDVNISEAQGKIQALKEAAKNFTTIQNISQNGEPVTGPSDFYTTQHIKHDGVAISGPSEFTTIQHIKTVGGGCFVAGTKIYMADGTTKPIEDVYLDDIVISYNTKTGNFEPHKVINGYTHHNTARVIDITFSNGVTVGATPSHPFLTLDGWKSRDPITSLDQHGILPAWLEIGDTVIGLNGNVQVTDIVERNIPSNFDTYDFEVEDCHTFLVEGLTVHNADVRGKAKGNATWLDPMGETFAKGNTTGQALAGGRTQTLMGELGPELYVSGGRYYVAGQNGAEFVNLPDDAIVFNHMQTKSLMSKGQTGHGKPVTSERNAISWAKGNITDGPAMASASAALAALKQLRAMWESLQKAKVSDLAGAGGGGGGGGGGGKNEKIVDPKAWVKTVERWYSLTQQIAKAEKEITHEEQLRAKLQSDFTKNGEHYFKSQMNSLKALKEQIAAQEQLNLSREDYYERRVAALETSPLGKIYQFDDKGQLQFSQTKIDGKSPMEWMTDLMGFDENGKANYTNKEKYEILQRAGFGDYMKYDSNGQQIKMDSDNDGEITDEERESFYEAATAAWRDRVDQYAEETQSLWDEIQEGQVELLKAQEEQNKLLEEMRNNQMEVENEVLAAIEDMKQREIDALQDERDKLEDSTNKYIDGLTNALDKERDMYDTQESQNELDTQKRRLAILQRSGASAADVSALQSEISANERDLYFDTQQAQIDAIKEASDLEIARLDSQIAIMQETLDYQKEFGLLWYQVYEVMDKSAPEITSFIMGNNSEFWSDSPLGSATNANDKLFQAEQWTGYREELNNNLSPLNDIAEWTRTQLADRDYQIFDKGMKAEFGENYDKKGKYKDLFYNEYKNGENPGDLTKVSSAVRSVYSYDAALAKRKKDAGNYWTNDGPDKYISIDDNQHWHYKYKKETIDGVEGYYFTSKAKENHSWDKNDKCSKCGHKKPAPTAAASSSPSNCTAANCSGVCKGDLYGGTSKSSSKCNVCGEQCRQTCSLNCSNDCVQTATGKKKAAGGYVNHGVYELGELGTETVLTASQTQVLRNNILSNRPNSLISLLKSYNENYSNISKPLSGVSSAVEDNSMNIDKVELTMNVQQLASDYDAKRAGEQALNEIMRIARKTTANNSIRR